MAEDWDDRSAGRPPPPSALPPGRRQPPKPPGNREQSALAKQRAFLLRTKQAAATTSARTAAAARRTKARIRRSTTAEGAGESGLAKLIELHAVNAAGDALIALSLAGSLFFGVPSGEARGKVALYLLITMAPFALVAPVIGPILDKFRNGRRGAIGGSFAVRAFLAWVMASAVADGGFALYPAAFGVLVASKAYVVTRSATVPRLLPPQVSLVRANSRISLAGVAGVAIATPIGVLVNLAGPDWTLRLTFVVFVIGTILSILLPRAMDSSTGEVDADILTTGPLRLPPEGGYPTPSADNKRSRLGNVGPAVVMGLRANAAIRGMSGFLTIYLLFLLRHAPISGMSPEVCIGLLGAAAVIGSTAGSVIGSRLRVRHPEMIIAGVMAIAAVTMIIGALFYGLWSVLLVAAVAAFSQQLGKLAFDAQVQRDVREEVRSSAFARTETALQLAWVIGGLLGITLPLNHTIGLGVIAAIVTVALLLVVRSLLQLRALRSRTRRRADGPEPQTP